jgi:hypothetical protein
MLGTSEKMAYRYTKRCSTPDIPDAIREAIKAVTERNTSYMRQL